MFKILALLLLVPALSQAGEARFELTREDQSVCKGRRAERVCYPIVEYFPDPFELIDFAVKHPGSYDVHRTTHLTANYRRISVRNFAVKDEGTLNEAANAFEYPFFASIYWQGRAYMEGTLHTEGVVRIRKGLPNLPKGEMPFELVFTQFSDSTTESEKVWLRLTEKSARHVHFLAVYGPRGDTEDATMRMLNELVAPGLLAEVFYSPVRR